MRELKFRAWDKERKEWQFFTLQELITGQASVIWTILDHWSQYTGLKDKNGKEIYEGDILQMYFRNNQKAGTPFPVAWNDKHAAFTDWCPREGVEVIGNIYENPSLLD